MATAVPVIAPAAFTGGDVSFGGFKATLLGTPTVSTDAATKGYVDAKGGGVVVGSGTGGRPVAPINGQAYWRTDKNFMEVWDGTNWRVQGVVVVSTLSDITTPTTGQMVIHSGDAYRMWQYDGSTWVQSGQMTNQTQGGEWTNTSGSAQSLAASGATKVSFPNRVVGSGTGITVSGGNTYSNDNEGLFMIDAQFRTSAGISCGVAVGISTYADGTLLAAPKPAAAPPWGDVGITVPIYLTSGTVFCIWFFNNTGGAVTISSATRAPRLRIWKVNTVA
jgi:hypothetical protein